MSKLCSCGSPLIPGLFPSSPGYCSAECDIQKSSERAEGAEWVWEDSCGGVCILELWHSVNVSPGPDLLEWTLSRYHVPTGRISESYSSEREARKAGEEWLSSKGYSPR